MKTLLRGGTVVNADGARRLDVLLEGEKILQVGRRLSGADETVDVTGCLLFPGFVDGRTHFGPGGETAPADDFASGTRSALRGGTTTVVDFACPQGDETLADALRRRQREADGHSYCDYGFHMTLPRWDETIRSQLPEVFAAGVSSFRFYLDRAHPLDDGALYLALKYLKRLGGVAAFHCENGSLIAAMERERLAAGKTGAAGYPMTHPEAAEAEAVGRLLRLAQAADAPVILSPITCRESLLELERARQRGQSAYATTCPQYLLLDDSVYYEGENASRYVCSPPLRDRSQQEPLWKALRRDSIQAVASSHRSFTLRQKETDPQDFTAIPAGLPGAENRGELLYTFGVSARRLAPEDLCRVLSEAPARLCGLYPKKGVLQPGSDADIVVYDPRASHVIRADDSLSRSDYNPYEGFVTSGGVTQVYLRGRLAVDQGAVLPAPDGRYLPRGKNSL